MCHSILQCSFSHLLWILFTVSIIAVIWLTLVFCRRDLCEARYKAASVFKFSDDVYRSDIARCEVISSKVAECKASVKNLCYLVNYITEGVKENPLLECKDDKCLADTFADYFIEKKNTEDLGCTGGSPTICPNK